MRMKALTMSISSLVDAVNADQLNAWDTPNKSQLRIRFALIVANDCYLLVYLLKSKSLNQ